MSVHFEAFAGKTGFVASWNGRFGRAARTFGRARGGNMAVIFGLVLLPLVSLAGAAVDYGRAGAVKTGLQTALDAAVIAGAEDGTGQWANTALALFQRNLVKEAGSVTPVFTANADGTFTGSATANVPTDFLGVVGVRSISVGATATAAAAIAADNSCILTLDGGQPTSDQSMIFNGAPAVSLSGCSIRSNTSMTCSGHVGGATASVAAGTVSGCSNPQARAAVVPDIYASLAGNITAKCAGARSNSVWSPGSPPANVITVSQSGYTEYHICGDLKLTGTGSLTGNAPTTDSIIVIENGSLTLANNASISAMRTAIVLTGNNAYASAINFPNGNGQSAGLSLSPPTDTRDPWRGIAVYQDPALTNGVAETWGPGATFDVDGVVYLPNADLVTSGNSSSNNSHCTKFVTHSFTTNGSPNINFWQTSNGCSGIGLTQWAGVPLKLTQ